jgi:DNA-directed RNA polymerase subunit RPC12/RpoP
MIEIDQLPIPDWGLRCSGCDAPLAGMAEHRCARCGRRFNIRQLLDLHRPVPDLGLNCQECGYPLCGLSGDRCPECGTEFSVREMLEDLDGPNVGFLTGFADPPDHSVKQREPTFTGHERPVPDFGLCCRNCESPLAGATGVTCPTCNEPVPINFDVCWNCNTPLLEDPAGKTP